MSYESTGFIKSIGEIQSFGSKGFKKCEVILSIPDGKYPQTISFEFQGDRSELPEKFKEGDEVQISFDLKGRLHEASGRNYNTLNAWKMTSLGGPVGRTATTADRSHPPANKAAQADHDLGKDDAGKEYPF